MTIMIFDLISTDAKKIFETCDRYVTIKTRHEEGTKSYDLDISVRAVSIDSSNIVITLPNSTIVALPISSVNYYRIEVL